MPKMFVPTVKPAALSKVTVPPRPSVNDAVASTPLAVRFPTQLPGVFQLPPDVFHVPLVKMFTLATELVTLVLPFPTTTKKLSLTVGLLVVKLVVVAPAIKLVAPPMTSYH